MDTPLNHSIGRKMLIAAVRRVRQPGCKFDYVVVLEGRQGTGKSSALRILAGDENFSDQPILHLDTRAQQEAMDGVWIYELSELAGLKRTEIETVKGFLTKTTDSARPAYGRYRTD
jgi:predicted P-loop ATPase